MDNLSFEEAMEKLEKVVGELENGKLSLDETLKKYEEGMKLSKYLNEILEKAEKEINVLTKGEDGNFTEEEFVAEE